mmetsp:Transcript_63244/g.135895  ORF Transcript_63244/g.135895 Transcript_63244/m.135895 type:complete len:202 (+) Transcript_63244:928-1533(+)
MTTLPWGRRRSSPRCHPSNSCRPHSAHTPGRLSQLSSSSAPPPAVVQCRRCQWSNRKWGCTQLLPWWSCRSPCPSGCKHPACSRRCAGLEPYCPNTARGATGTHLGYRPSRRSRRRAPRPYPPSKAPAMPPLPSRWPSSAALARWCAVGKSQSLSAGLGELGPVAPSTPPASPLASAPRKWPCNPNSKYRTPRIGYCTGSH